MSTNSQQSVEECASDGHIFSLLKAGNIRHFAYVPDAGHASTIALAHEDESTVTATLTTEEEGIGYLTGAWLGGERGVLLMQSSGVGNCINMLSLSANMQTPLLMLVTMRGEWAEFNPWQLPMGQVSEEALQLMGVMTWRADHAEDLAPLINGAITTAFESNGACAVMIGQRLIGEKTWVE